MKRPLIGLAISVACLVLSFGLCGFGGADRSGNTSNFLIGAGLLLLAASILGGVACVIWLLVVLIRGKN